MTISLTNGLSDLSRELGESTTNQTTRRIEHYNDAVVQFSNDKKWKFLLKKNTDLVTIAATTSYTIPSTGMDDRRSPGWAYAIYVGSDTTPYLPIAYEDRGDASLQGKKYFYIDPEDTTIYFMADLGAAGQTITVHYYHIPARTSDTSAGSFAIPDRYRKTVATLAAAFVQWGRYLDTQGNRLFNVYQRMLGDAEIQQEEQPTGKPKRLKHPLAYRGFRRSYP